jgi:hypothetical protein
LRKLRSLGSVHGKPPITGGEKKGKKNDGRKLVGE